MLKKYCEYCGELLINGCRCEQEIYDSEQELIETLEDRQTINGFYAYQDEPRHLDNW